MIMLTANISKVMSSSLMTGLILVVVVFSTLLVLSLVIGVFGKMGARDEAPAAKKPPVAVKPTAKPVVAPAVASEDEDEIAAVIAAAVAMMAPAGMAYRVRRITQVGASKRSEWAAAAVRQNTMPF